MKNLYYEVMKALRCCSGKICDECPLICDAFCRKTLADHARYMMYNLNAENEKLKKDNECFADIGKMFSEVKADVLKEIFIRVHNKAVYSSSDKRSEDFIRLIDFDGIIKEMEKSKC